MFSPLFLMDMNHHTAAQKATANSSVGLVTLEREVGGSGNEARERRGKRTERGREMGRVTREGIK